MRKYNLIKIIVLFFTFIEASCSVAYGQNDSNLYLYSDYLYGYKSKTDSSVVIKAQYTYAKSFCCGLAVVRDTSSLLGYIDEKGNTVIPFCYNNARSFGDGINLMNDAKGFENLALVNKGGYITHLDSPYGLGRWGLIDKKGNIVLPIEYDYIDTLHNGMAIVTKGDHVSSDGSKRFYKLMYAKYGFVNEKGKLIVPPIYDKVNLFENDTARVRQNGMEFLINKKGECISTPQSYIEDGYNWEVFYDVKTELYGYINSKKEIVIKPKYKMAYKFREGLARVKDIKTNKYGFINVNDSLIIPCVYDDARSFGESYNEDNIPEFKNLAMIKLGGKWGLIDKKGNIVQPIKYLMIFGLAQNRALVISGNRKEKEDKTGVDIENKHLGFLDENGYLVIDTIYDKVSSTLFINDTVSVIKDEMEFVIDKYGKTVTKPTPIKKNN